MESKLKAAAQDSVGELPNLLLREGGYPHLPTTPIKQEPKADAWNDAGTKPDHPCLCRTRATERSPQEYYNYWNGEFWGLTTTTKELAFDNKDIRTEAQYIQWREVQP